MSQKLRFIKQQQPKFIQQFKERVGLKQDPTLDDKKENEIVKPAFDERSDDEDEKPVVVVLNQGDLTREEAEEAPAHVKDKKMVYRKPENKRSANTPLTTSTKKPKLSEQSEERKSEGTGEKNKGNKSKKSKKTKPTSSLLSFNNDDEEES
ncbi:uncharacterized protein KIAA1143 homolog [Clavelina lepadiformis]|uniref:uncharacterized protein KIAA1143 homolog n=1 Tax=Clavelina lepadiformis TaxID=159417 RepID=UPI004041D976